jgi:hypothetical protein
MDEGRNMYMILFDDAQVKRSLGSPECTWAGAVSREMVWQM